MWAQKCLGRTADVRRLLPLSVVWKASFVAAGVVHVCTGASAAGATPTGCRRRSPVAGGTESRVPSRAAKISPWTGPAGRCVASEGLRVTKQNLPKLTMPGAPSFVKHEEERLFTIRYK